MSRRASRSPCRAIGMTSLVACVLGELGIDDRDDVVMAQAPQNLDLLAEAADAVLAPQPLQRPFARKLAGRVGDAVYVPPWPPALIVLTTFQRSPYAFAIRRAPPKVCAICPRPYPS